MNAWKERVLRSPQEILRVRRNGQRLHTRLFQIIYSAKEQDRSRFAVIVYKQLGIAVVRNRTKRRYREIIRKEIGLQSINVDMVVIPKAGSLKEGFRNLQVSIQKAIKRISL